MSSEHSNDRGEPWSVNERTSELCDRDGHPFANLYRGAYNFGVNIVHAMNLLQGLNINQVKPLLSVIKEVHSQQADDLCWLDIDKIFAAVGLPVPDRKVGDKMAMLSNCARFIATMCEGGKWKSYVDLERDYDNIKKLADHRSLQYKKSIDLNTMLDNDKNSLKMQNDKLQAELKEAKSIVEYWKNMCGLQNKKRETAENIVSRVADSYDGGENIFEVAKEAVKYVKEHM